MIQFLLNGQSVSESSLRADTTLLQYLRGQAGLVGTKEGCASGDCGACTVLVGSWQATRWVYESVNSCLLLLASVHGKQILTIEALASAEGLHPAQQAMVDCSGSQCGFCTPGFVMSLTGLYYAVGPDAPAEAVHQALSGNLCRCTGYKSILAAAQAMATYPASALPGELRFWQPPVDAQTEMPTDIESVVPSLGATDKAYVPQTEQALQQLLAVCPQARLIGGGTDANLQVTQQYQSLGPVIVMTQVAELQQLQITDREISIGAGVSYERAATAIKSCYPSAALLLERIGSLQIRHSATLAGNLANASPIGDGPPMLMAMQAQIEIGNSDGARLCSVEDFITGYKQTCLQPGDYIRRVLIPLPAADRVYTFTKVSKRFEDDIATVMLASRVSIRDGVIRDVCLAFGGMAATPERASHVESLLINQSPAALDYARITGGIFQDFSPISDVRASADYRLALAQNLIIKLVLALQGNREPSDVWSMAG